MNRLNYYVLLSLMAVGIVGGSAQSQPSSQDARAVISLGNALSPFPTGFLGHPIAYAFAVFSQLMIFSFALGVIMYIGRAIEFKRDGCYRGGKLSWRSPVNVYKMQWILLMVAVCCGVGPNLLVYLSWGEVSGDTMARFLTIDKLMKGFGFIPFTAAIYLFIENDEDVILHLSMDRTCQDPIWPIAPAVRQHIRTAVIVVAASVAITLIKYYGLNPQ